MRLPPIVKLHPVLWLAIALAIFTTPVLLPTWGVR